MSGAPDRRVVAAVFQQRHGVPDWQARNRDGALPSRWPYGLDLLESADVEVTHREVAPVGRGLRLALASRVLDPRVLRRLRSRSPGTIDAALSWDENTALAMVTRVRARRQCTGVIWVTDAAGPGTSPRYLAAVRTALRSMDALWVLAAPQVERLAAWLGPGHPPIHFVRFGVDVDYYRPSPYPATPLITSFGNDRDRDVPTLYAALEKVRAARPDVRCVVQTNSPLPVPAGVATHERLPHAQVRDLLAASSVVAVATRANWHASGMTVALEAAASARPVVACRTPGMADYVRDGETGLLVEPGDADALADATLGLLGDPSRAEAFGRRAREVAAAEHSTATMARALRAIAVSAT